MPDSSKTATIELDICGARAIKAKTKGQHAKVEPVVEFFARAGLADIEIRRVEADPRDQGDIPIRHPRA